MDRIVGLVADPARRQELHGPLRALTGPLLDVVVTRHREDIEPLEQALAYAARQISADLDGRTLADSPTYLLGWVDALLDICAVGIDRGLSTVLVQQASGRLHVREILATLVEQGSMTASTLAKAVGISPNHLSNLLRWMEPNGLVRRAIAGRTTLVSLGPKGEAVYLALGDEDRKQQRPHPNVSAANVSQLAEQRRQRNLVLVRQMAEEGQLAPWLLQGLAEGRFDPVLLDPGVRSTELLASLFQDLPAADRGRFKDAVVEAVGQWRPPADSLQTLRDLADLALAIGATDVIRAVRSHIEQEAIDHGSQEGLDTIAALIAVLGGFRAMDQAHDALRRFFWDERFHPELTADLFIALCSTEPARYPLYLPRLLIHSDYYETHRESGFLQRTLAKFADITGWDTICAHMHKMHELPRESILQFIQIVGWAELITRLEDVPRDTLEVFVFRALTWPLVAETLPALDAPSREQLLSLLLRRGVAILSWNEDDGLPLVQPAKPVEGQRPHVNELLGHKMIWRTICQETRRIDELYQMVDNLN